LKAAVGDVMKVTHRERLQACITKDRALDRPPVALWRHFPVDDQSPETLAAATLAFQQQFDFDLVKITPASSFCLKDWGAQDVWDGNTEGTRRYIKRVIESPLDWERLAVLNPDTAPHLAGQLSCIRLIRNELSPEIPILQTIFSPLAQAKNLVGGKVLIEHLRRYPDALMKGLMKITETTRRFVEAALEIGIDGIFFAIQHAQAGELSLLEYKTFGLPNDMIVLEPVGSLAFNLLHLHGKDVYFELISSYSSFFSIVNWHDRETFPTLDRAQGLFTGAVCGGVNQHNVVYGTKSEVHLEARDAIKKTNGNRFILGTGCVVPIIAPYGNIMAIRQSVDDIK
jgi:uroporphyrinogen decarboxylase